MTICNVVTNTFSSRSCFNYVRYLSQIIKTYLSYMYLKLSPLYRFLVISNYPICSSYSGCLRNNAKTYGLNNNVYFVHESLV